MPRRGKIIKVENQEAKNDKVLTKALLAMFLAAGGSLALSRMLPIMSLKVATTILGLRMAAKRLAIAHSKTYDLKDSRIKQPYPLAPTSEADRLLIAATALNLLATISRHTQANLLVGSSYNAAVVKAIKTSSSAISRTATTETFKAYNQQYSANHASLPGNVVWNALLDKHVCQRCADLEGSKWPAASDHPMPPMHINCRCTLYYTTY
jgi:SPP1 gp7 family putative phage head morphogenesis protein